MHDFLDVRKSSERQARKKFYIKCSKNSRSQIVFGTDTFQKLTLGVPERLLGTVYVLKFRSV